jgi:hypothetical protein
LKKDKLSSLQEFLQDAERRRFLPVIGDDNARTLDNLSRLAFGVELAQAGPLAERHRGRHSHQVNVRFVAQSLDQLGVIRLVAVLRQNAQQRLSGFNRLARLSETSVQAVFGQGLLEHDLQRAHEVHRFISSRFFGGDFFDNFFGFSAVKMKIKEKVTMSAFSFGFDARCKPRRRRRKENRLQISLFAARKDLSLMMTMMTERNPRDTNARAREERERERERRKKEQRLHKLTQT